MKTINFLDFAMDLVGVAVDFLSSFVDAVWRIFKTSVAAVWRVRGVTGSTFLTILLKSKLSWRHLGTRK